VQVGELVEIVEVGPDVAVDGVVRWRCVDLKDVVAARFAAALSERQVGRILNRRGTRACATARGRIHRLVGKLPSRHT
jgi:hypothetical protein